MTEFKGNVEVQVEVRGEKKVRELFENVHWDVFQGEYIEVYDKKAKDGKIFLELMASWDESDKVDGVKSKLTFHSLEPSVELPNLSANIPVIISEVNLEKKYCKLLTQAQIDQKNWVDNQW